MMSNLKLNNELRNLTPLEHLRIFLRGAGQVMFQPSAWTGLLFIIGIFWGAYTSHTPEVAWGALLGLFVSTLTGYLIDMPSDDGKQGLWGFNGVLVGCAFPTFLGNTVWVWIALVLCSAMTVWVRTGMNNVMAPWRVNSFTFPFVFCTWIFILAARAMNSMPPDSARGLFVDNRPAYHQAHNLLSGRRFTGLSDRVVGDGTTLPDRLGHKLTHRRADRLRRLGIGSARGTRLWHVGSRDLARIV